MTRTNWRSIEQWTNAQALALSALCLTVGVCGGWLIRSARPAAAPAPAVASSVPAPADAGMPAAPLPPTPEQLKELADNQAKPLLEKLKAAPNDPALLIGIGNLYYDGKLYPTAIDYYGRALKAQPSNAAVRTDMATAYWYQGNADQAISEFNKALTYEPNNPNTLFNRGLVKWRGKNDVAGAMADWQHLLTANPNYAEKDAVKQMMADAGKQASGKTK